MNASDAVHDGAPAGALFDTKTTTTRRRRRTPLQRVRSATRRHGGTGVFLAMLVACVALVALSR